MFKHLALFMMVSMHCIFMHSQVVVNSILRDPKTVLESFSDQQRDSLKDVTEGRVILNSTTNCINYYSVGKWFSLCGGCLPEVPTVKPDSVVFSNGKLAIYFEDKAAIKQNVEKFQITVLPLKWVFVTDQSPFILDVVLDSVYAKISVAGIGQCGLGKEVFTDSVLVYTYHPCVGKTSVTDARDNKTYELVEIGDQCWTKGYIKFIPNSKTRFLNEPKAVFYEWKDFSIEGNNMCPAGYHVPKKSEVDRFAESVDDPYNQFSTKESYDQNLKELGVEFLGGYNSKKEESFKGISDFFWTQELMNKQDAYLGLLNSKGSMVVSAPKNSYMPIRCIKD